MPNERPGTDLTTGPDVVHGWKVYAEHPGDAQKIVFADDLQSLTISDELRGKAIVYATNNMHTGEEIQYLEIELDFTPSNTIFVEVGVARLTYGEGSPPEFAHPGGYTRTASNRVKLVIAGAAPNQVIIMDRAYEVSAQRNVTVGCGTNPLHGTIFFTVNGRWSHLEAFDRAIDTRVAVELGTNHRFKSSTVSPCLKFFPQLQGQQNTTFLFDIEAYRLRAAAAATRVLARKPHIPPELWQFVIVECASAILKEHHEQPESFVKILSTFAKYSLVCKKWSAAFRPMIFEQLVVDEPRALEALNAAAQHPSFPLEEGRLLTESLSESLPSKPSLVTHLPHLRTLHWEASDDEGVSPHIEHRLPALLGTLKHLTALEINKKNFRTFAQVLFIIRHIPDLQDLKLQQVSFSHKGPVRPEHLSAATGKLRSLSWSTWKSCSWHPASRTVETIMRLCGVQTRTAAMVNDIFNASFEPRVQVQEPWGERWGRWELSVECQSADCSRPAVNFEFEGDGALYCSLTFTEWLEHTSQHSMASMWLSVTGDPPPDTPSYYDTLLSRLDLHTLRGYPLSISLMTRNEEMLASLRQRLPDLMPHSTTEHLVIIEGYVAEESDSDDEPEQPTADDSSQGTSS
ncbi:hypothetical protein PsYK624_123210 [Phanerochaete sordida]|uniref:Uncharacterized protein n=1 Tax=Phanerochaete sordida TaxID=48140 RepID=A0A9P3GJL0_9APHY|nr:hypothetical protein PsYK624_123210 [Phanerochaete sordida]